MKPWKFIVTAFLHSVGKTNRKYLVYSYTLQSVQKGSLPISDTQFIKSYADRNWIDWQEIKLIVNINGKDRSRKVVQRQVRNALLQWSKQYKIPLSVKKGVKGFTFKDDKGYGDYYDET